MHWSAHTMGLASYSALLCLHSFTSEFALSFARSALCSCYSCQDLMPPRIHYHYHSLRPKKNSRRPTLVFSKCAAIVLPLSRLLVVPAAAAAAIIQRANTNALAQSERLVPWIARHRSELGSVEQRDRSAVLVMD